MFNTLENRLLQYFKNFLKRYHFIKRCYFCSRRLFFSLTRQNKKPKKLHLGCGNKSLKGYINIDVSTNSTADMVFDIRNIDKFFKKDTIVEILTIHTISYLRLFDTRHFLSACFNILIPSGKLIIEFPDIVKCSRMIVNNNNIVSGSGDIYVQYIEGIRGFYAFDLDQIKNKVRFTPYTFGWSANHMKYELMNIGFRQIFISDGNAHEKPQRDTRVEAVK